LFRKDPLEFILAGTINLSSCTDTSDTSPGEACEADIAENPGDSGFRLLGKGLSEVDGGKQKRRRNSALVAFDRR
jgi:hypothetical protein